jgi:hypothetical protein
LCLPAAGKAPGQVRVLKAGEQLNLEALLTLSHSPG